MMDIVFSENFTYMSVSLSIGVLGNESQMSYLPADSFVAQWKEDNVWIGDEFTFKITMSLIEMDEKVSVLHTTR